jgi:hypothetical protein
MSSDIKHIVAFTESDAYSVLFEDRIKDSLNCQEKMILFYYRDIILRGLKNTRINRLEYAYHLLSKVDVFLSNQTNRNSTLSLIIKNIFYPAQSYYLYKIKKYDESKKLLFKTLFINKQLKKEGWNFIVFNSVQQYHNLARIYFFKNDFSRGIDIVKHLLLYLLGESIYGEENLQVLLSNEDSQNYLRLRHLMITQILRETLQILIKNDLNVFNRFARILAESIKPLVNNYKPVLDDDIDLIEWIGLFLDFFFRPNKFILQADNYYKKNDRSKSSLIMQLKNIHGQNCEILVSN